MKLLVCQTPPNKSYLQGLQSDGGKNKATDRGILIDHSPLMGRIPEIDELPKYPALARVNALHVMSVWGVAGAGKSALVRNLYHIKVHMLQNNEFDKHGWVDVSYPFNLRVFCLSLLLQFHSHFCQSKRSYILQHERNQRPHRRVSQPSKGSPVPCCY